MSYDPVVREHQEWLGFVQPVGLVVSPTALKQAQAFIAHNVTALQQILLRHTHESIDANRNLKRRLNRFSDFAQEFWGWQASDLATPPDSLSTALQEYGEILRPDFAVPAPPSKNAGDSDWQILIQQLPASPTPGLHNMDQGGQNADERSWQASPQARFERLLRDIGVPIGILVSPDAIRLVYAPRGESAGHITFPIQAMCETAGRPIVAALHLLLDDQRLFSAPTAQRLPAILQASRKYQNEVSIKLAGQVLRALNELCRGFNEANRVTGGELLAQTLKEAPTELYGGLLTTLMRMVFLLYAEDRNLMASDETYQRCYSLIGLHEKLREDAANYPDTMDQRFGAWAQFLTLSRLAHDGGGHGNWRLPARRGRLFDPDCYPFLEGRAFKNKRTHGQTLSPPKVSDGVLYRALEDLLYLDGERISYRALDVEQIGSVYEAMMGFEVKLAEGSSIGFKPDHVVVNLETVLTQAPADRKKWLKEHVGWEPAEKAAQALKVADSTEALLSALDTRISPLYKGREGGNLSVATGDIYLQPTEERRRSGSHYTPRSLTEPIVRTTLDPVLQQLGENPTPEQILNLKVCDPAMGSGAFLVEACRYLGDALVKAWAAHKTTPKIPADQDPLLHARRIIAQRCLYGVDKNPFAVDLAKLSLWLATFAKDHPFTFLDHSFRHGDSLVGLSFEEIMDALGDGSTLFRPLAEERIKKAIEARRSIVDSVELTSYDLLEIKYQLSRQAVGTLRDLGDAVISSFFLEGKAKERSRRRIELAEAFDHERFDQVAEAIRVLRVDKAIVPFHWETEFPEVFQTGGFTAIVGNPPFLGGTMISTNMGMAYFDYLTSHYEGAGHLCDLVAYFFRRSFSLIKQDGTMGLVATNTITQGDTREGGLAWIVRNGGNIFSATRRLTWPNKAAVKVSIVHIKRGNYAGLIRLDGRTVQFISAFLFHQGSSNSPARLSGLNEKFSAGSKIYGQGFLFDDSDPQSSPNSERFRILSIDPRYAERIFPYVGGEELNQLPRQDARRHVIYLSDLATEEDLSTWPELRDIVRAKVYPERMELGNNPNNTPLRRKWWAYQAHRPSLYSQARSLSRVLCNSQVSQHLAFAFLPTDIIFAHTLNVFCNDSDALFGIMQSNLHETWVRFFGSTLEDRLRYTASDCFETFPFPLQWSESESLEQKGKKYYEFRADVMVRNNEGLTKTYNRFHDKNEEDEDIQKLRDLHAQMDRAVLDAYGWTELQPVNDFILDYEEQEEELESGRGRKKKRPWRYRWTDEFRDEVLSRLLELNRQRAAAELEAKVGQSTQPAKAATKTARKAAVSSSRSFFDEEVASNED